MGDTGIDVEAIMQNAMEAAAVFAQLDQAHTDRIVRAVYRAALDNRVRLARLAHEETGLGNWRDKVIKNVVATQLVYEDIKNLKTVGVIGEDEERGITEIASPLGPIFAIIPMTNPTSTVFFKILIALKTRNPLIIRPHRRSARCSNEAARLCYEAALGEDAPEHCIQWVEHMSRDETQRMMAHPGLALVLATGGGALVKAAYSSGTPAFGVGAGNVPVFIERSADIPFAAEQILLSKTFDNGTVCASEQALVVEQAVSDQLCRELTRRGALFLDPEQTRQLGEVVFDRDQGVMKGEIVGQPAPVLARLAGFEVPEDTRLLVAPLDGVGPGYPLSAEILAPVLAYYTAPDLEAALNLCIDLNYYGGTGHTASIFSNNATAINLFATHMNAGRLVVNMPSSQGGVGGICNRLHPSLTLGCGSGGKNITTDNITARHLLNIQRITHRRLNERFAAMDQAAYFDESVDATALGKRYNKNF